MLEEESSSVEFPEVKGLISIREIRAILQSIERNDGHPKPLPRDNSVSENLHVIVRISQKNTYVTSCGAP